MNHNHDPDAFDSAGFADYLRDAAFFLLVLFGLLLITSPVWLP